MNKPKRKGGGGGGDHKAPLVFFLKVMHRETFNIFLRTLTLALEEKNTLYQRQNIYEARVTLHYVVVNIQLYYMASSASGQGEPNRAL